MRKRTLQMKQGGMKREEWFGAEWEYLPNVCFMPDPVLGILPTWSSFHSSPVTSIRLTLSNRNIHWGDNNIAHIYCILITRWTLFCALCMPYFFHFFHSHCNSELVDAFNDLILQMRRLRSREMWQLAHKQWSQGLHPDILTLNHIEHLKTMESEV